MLNIMVYSIAIYWVSTVLCLGKDCPYSPGLWSLQQSSMRVISSLSPIDSILCSSTVLCCSVRDVVAGDRLTIIRTYSSVSEYFGWYDGESVRTPRLATELGHARDVMAKGISDQETWGIVKPDCLTGHPQQWCGRRFHVKTLSSVLETVTFILVFY